jgi:hypothetical protein
MMSGTLMLEARAQDILPNTSRRIHLTLRAIRIG